MIQHVGNPQLEFPPQVAGLPKEYLLGVPRPVVMKDFFEEGFTITLRVRDRPEPARRSGVTFENWWAYAHAPFLLGTCPNLALARDAPESRSIQPEPMGRVVALPRSAGCITATNDGPPETLPP